MTRIALLGYPVAHSLSPAIQHAAFDLAGLNWTYEAIPTPPEALQATLERMRAEAWRGANVTIPLKQAVLPRLDDLDPSALETSAVNTIVNDDGRLVGYNTDGAGFLHDLQLNWRFPRDGPALILGAGGGARAVSFSLAARGIELRILARTTSRAEALAQDIRRLHASKVSVFPWAADSFQRASSACVLIVNATPIGMFPDSHLSPWPAEVKFPPTAFVYDLIYRPAETRLVRLARLSGLQAANGAGMLVEQGALSFERWTGLRAPRRQMRAALDQALEGLYA